MMSINIALTSFLSLVPLGIYSVLGCLTAEEAESCVSKQRYRLGSRLDQPSRHRLRDL